jgi:ribonuclease J
LPVDGAALQQRRRVGNQGGVVATVIIDHAGELAAPPQISLIGLVEANEAERASAALRDAVTGTVDALPRPMKRDDGSVRDAVNRTLRRALNERFGKRALIDIQLVRL